MKTPDFTQDMARVKRLHSYQILDTDSEQRFDDLARLASHICGTPVAMITLIDSDRQWVKSSVGYPPVHVPRETAFCSHTILGNEMLIIRDAAEDKRFEHHPLVTGETHLRFYAGMPFFSFDGFALGSLCVLDDKPRDLSDEQKDALRALARQVEDQMELRRHLLDMKSQMDEKSAADEDTRRREEYIRKILETSRDGVLVEENEKVVFMNTAYAKLFGRASANELMGLHLSELAAPHDLPRLLEYGRRRSLGEEAPSLYDFQIRNKNGDFVDVEASVSVFTYEDKKYIITFARDIMERKRNEKEREKLIAELKAALGEVKTLSGLLPICASCKKIRDDKGYWNQLEYYIEAHTKAMLTHGICPECVQKLYPEEND